MSSEWGKNIRLRLFGRSHEEYVGVELFGIPKGIKLSVDEMAAFMKRRSPGNFTYTSGRKEADVPIIVSGIEDGYTDGSALRIIVRNEDGRPSDYEKLRYIPRPGHADYTAYIKWNGKEDMRGGGKFSGRLTAPLCAAGYVALQILREQEIGICAHVSSLGSICDDSFDPLNITDEVFAKISEKEIPVISETVESEMQSCLKELVEQGDSVGGVIECAVCGLPIGIGDSFTEGLESTISSLVFGVPGVKGIEFGSGFRGSTMRGSQNNDPYIIKDGKISCTTNNAGGILGGISNGMPLIFRAAMKPTPSIAVEQNSVNLLTKENTVISIKGRHDPCIALRAVPVIEACAALAVLDAIYAGNCGRDTLSECRNEIDRLDIQISNLLTKRLRVSECIAEIKATETIPIRDEARENAVIRRIKDSNPSQYADSLAEIYEKIMEISRKHQTEIIRRDRQNGEEI